MNKRGQLLQDIAHEIKWCPVCRKGEIGLPVVGEGSSPAPVIQPEIVVLLGRSL